MVMSINTQSDSMTILYVNMAIFKIREKGNLVSIEWMDSAPYEVNGKFATDFGWQRSRSIICPYSRLTKSSQMLVHSHML